VTTILFILFSRFSINKKRRMIKGLFNSEDKTQRIVYHYTSEEKMTQSQRDALN